MRCYILFILLASLHICSADLVDPISGTRFSLKWEASTGLTTYRSTILYDDGKIVVASNGQTSNGVIDPLETRSVLAHGLSAALNHPQPDEKPFGIFRM